MRQKTTRKPFSKLNELMIFFLQSKSVKTSLTFLLVVFMVLFLFSLSFSSPVEDGQFTIKSSSIFTSLLNGANKIG